MGKKDKKKQGLGLEKTLAKEQKKHHKRLQDEYGEDDIDTIVKNLNKQQATRDAALTTMQVNPLTAAPSPRSSASIVHNPLKPAELVLFGGEFYDGRSTGCYNNLFIYNLQTKDWREVISPHSPTPRSSHQCCVVRTDNSALMYVFGGEFSSRSGEQFRQFNDLHTLDLQSYAWERIEPSASDSSSKKKSKPVVPPARSGHRLIYDVKNRRLVVFGGFSDNRGNITYLNDLWSFSLDTQQWTAHTPASATAPVPPSRSGFIMGYDEKSDAVWVYGGFSEQPKPTKKLPANSKAASIKQKLLASQSMSDTIPVTLNDLWHLNLQTMQWSPIKKTGLWPSLRSSISGCVLPSRQWLVLFGGVSAEDNNKHTATVDSDSDDDDETVTCHCDTFVYDMAQRQFFSVDVRGVTSSPDPSAVQLIAKRKEQALKRAQAAAAKESKETEQTTEDSEPASVFDFNPVVESLAISSTSSTAGEASSSPNSKAGSNVNAPYPRRSAMLTPISSTEVLLYGGVQELADDGEVTLADMHRMDVAAGRREWQQLIGMPNYEQLVAVTRTHSDDDDADDGKDESDSGEETFDDDMEDDAEEKE